MRIMDAEDKLLNDKDHRMPEVIDNYRVPGEDLLKYIPFCNNIFVTKF